MKKAYFIEIYNHDASAQNKVYLNLEEATLVFKEITNKFKEESKKVNSSSFEVKLAEFFLEEDDVDLGLEHAISTGEFDELEICIISKGIVQMILTQGNIVKSLIY